MQPTIRNKYVFVIQEEGGEEKKEKGY